MKPDMVYDQYAVRIREATEFTSGEGPGIFRGGGLGFFTLSQGGPRIFSPLVRGG